MEARFPSSRARASKCRNASGRSYAVGDDITIYTGESHQQEQATFFTLRQQLSKRDGRPNMALSDFVAPRGSACWITSGASW